VSRLTDAVKEATGEFGGGVRRFPASVRTAVRDPRSLTAGAAVLPIAVLFGHTFLDAFDRTGFFIILPEVQEHFDLDLEEITGLASIAIVAGIALSLPVSLWSDRSARRTWFLGGGAVIASLCSLLGAVARSIGLFGTARAGFGFGLIVNDPVQQSLLADLTPVEARASVYGGRQIADNVGSLLGPLVFGLVTWLAGWRASLVVVAVLGLVLAAASFRLREPTKGVQERAAMGVTGDDLHVEEETAGFRESWRLLVQVPTVRTLWFSLPFLVGGVLCMLVLVPLYLEEVHGLSAAERGITQALLGIPAIFGLFVGISLTKRFLFSDAPWRMFRLMAGVAASASLCVVWMAVVGPLALVLAGLGALLLLSSLILPAYGTLFSIVMPARARTVGFALTRVWALPGLVMLPIAGAIGDAHGLRWGIVVGLPVFLVGAAVVGAGGRSFQADMAAAHEASMAAVEQQRAARAAASTGTIEPAPDPLPEAPTGLEPRAPGPTLAD
jgi:MFS family permease